jgi:hypothetical protein
VDLRKKIWERHSISRNALKILMIELRLHNCKHKHKHAPITLLICKIHIKVHVIFLLKSCEHEGTENFISPVCHSMYTYFLIALCIPLTRPTAALILPKECFIVDRIVLYINLDIDHIFLTIFYFTLHKLKLNTNGNVKRMDHSISFDRNINIFHVC